MKLRLLASLFIAALSARAAEPAVRDGLLLWLDVSAQPEVRQAASLPPIGNRQPVDILVDSLNQARQAVQPVAERRPVFITDSEIAYVQFDGKDDFLAVSGARQLAPAITVFVLAAPKANAGISPRTVRHCRGGEERLHQRIEFDFGPQPTKELSVLNVESGGATGFRDLLVPGIFECRGAALRRFSCLHRPLAHRARPARKSSSMVSKAANAIGSNR